MSPTPTTASPPSDFHQLTKLPLRRFFSAASNHQIHRQENTLFFQVARLGNGVQWPFAIGASARRKVFEIFPNSVTVTNSKPPTLFRFPLQHQAS